jgi:hypothetical protein
MLFVYFCLLVFTSLTIIKVLTASSKITILIVSMFSLFTWLLIVINNQNNDYLTVLSLVLGALVGTMVYTTILKILESLHKDSKWYLYGIFLCFIFVAGTIYLINSRVVLNR